MSHINIQKSEIAFLKSELIKKYCDSIKADYSSFTDELTGTISHYEKISDQIIEELCQPEKIAAYEKGLESSPIKIMLRKWLSNSQEEVLKKVREISSYVTSNVLRKLIFFNKDVQELAFKENFILACYIYLNKDRNKFLNELRKIKKGAKDTVLPTAGNGLNPKSKGTIHPDDVKQNKFRLVPLKNDDQIDNSSSSLEFSGDEIILNRDNLDSENITITSKIQATIKFTDGNWCIENLSKLKTTYIQVLRPTKLNKGDIIIFGNKRFIFDQ